MVSDGSAQFVSKGGRDENGKKRIKGREEEKFWDEGKTFKLLVNNVEHIKITRLISFCFIISSSLKKVAILSLCCLFYYYSSPLLIEKKQKKKIKLFFLMQFG